MIYGYGIWYILIYITYNNTDCNDSIYYWHIDCVKCYDVTACCDPISVPSPYLIKIN